MPENASSFLKTCPARIKNHMREVCYGPGDLILEQGQEPEAVFFLLEGEVKVFHLVLNDIQLLEYIYSNEGLFGEIEVLNGQPVLADVRAATSCKVIRLEKTAFLDWLRSDAEFALSIAGQTADKLYAACLSSAANIAYPLKYRVLFFLWSRQETGITSISKSDLVTGLGSNERSINRILKELMDAGLVTVEHGLIHSSSSRSLLLSEMRKFE
jgi:CRP-like cAMP-binding protein